MQQRYECDFVAADMQSAVNVYGEVFTVGEKVTHQDKSAGSATIERFRIADDGDIIAYTNKGVASLPYLEKVTQPTDILPTIVRCNSCGRDPKLVPAKQITGKDHPAKGVKLSRAYVLCQCGWASAMRDIDAAAIREWNKIMGGTVS